MHTDLQRIHTLQSAISGLKKLQEADRDANFEDVWRRLKDYEKRLYARLTPIEELELDREMRSADID